MKRSKKNLRGLMFYCQLFELTRGPYNETTKKLVYKYLTPWVHKRSNMDALIRFQGADR